MKFAAVLLLAIAGASSYAQTPVIGIPSSSGGSTAPISGTGAPSLPCSSANDGQPYFDKTNSHSYTCNGTTSTWIDTTGSGGGATFPSTNCIVSNTSTTASVCTTAPNVTALLDNAGATNPLQTYSYNPKTAALMQSGGLYPTLLHGLYLFNECSGTVLHDVSGNGNDCTIPTGTGAPTWITDGGACALAWPANNISANNQVSCPGITSPSTVQVVMNFTQTGTNTGDLRPVFGYSTSPGVAVLEYAPTSTQTAGALPTYNIAVQPSSSFATTMPSGNGYNLLSFSIGGSSSQFFFNDQLQYSVGGISNVPIPTGGHLELGGCHSSNCTGGTVLYGARMYFAAAYETTPVTNANLLANFQNIKSRFLSLGINVGQQQFIYTTAVPNNIVVCCTSIEAGVGGNNAPASLMTLGSNYTVHVSGVPSAKFQQKLTSGFQEEKYFLNPNANNVLLFMDPITNDLCASAPSQFSVPTVQQAWAIVEQGVAAAKIAGFNQVGIGTTISRSGNAVSPNTGSCDAARDTWNTLARQGATSLGAFLVDQASIPQVGADGASTNATYFVGDGTHPTLVGEQLIALSGMQPAILANTSPFSLGNPNQQNGTTYSMGAADRYLLGNPPSAAAWNLPDCLGLTSDDYNITNISANSITMSAVNSETITGSATVAANTPSATFTAMLTAASTGGCYWLRYR